MEYCYIEFVKKDDEKIDKLISIIETMKNDIVGGRTDIDKKWFGLFSEEEINQFWWPNQYQYEEIKKLFGDLPIIISNKQNNPRGDWDIYSMFEAINGSEYDLIGVRMIQPNIYRLEFHPYAYPYGGAQSLQKLISCLGHKIVAVDDGTGRVDTIKDQAKKQERKKAWWKFW